MDPDSSMTQRRARFEALVDEVLEPIRRFLARRTDPATADDVLGEVLLVLWRRLDAVPTEALPWTYAVARNCLANAERGVRRQHRVAARIAVLDPPAATSPEDPAQDDRVHRALALVPQAQAELLRLWAWEQLAPSEIASVLDVSANAVSIRLHRARENFKTALRKIDADAGHELPNEGSAP